jgi:hypothetical protein
VIFSGRPYTSFPNHLENLDFIFAYTEIGFASKHMIGLMHIVTFLGVVRDL